MNEPWRAKVMDHLILWGDYIAEKQRTDAKYPLAKALSDFAGIFILCSFFRCLWDIHPEESFRAHVATNSLIAVVGASVQMLSSRKVAKKAHAAVVNKPGI